MLSKKVPLFIPNICVLIFLIFSKLSQEELNDVQDFVNRRIESKLPLVEQRNITMETAINDGALALFGEKYGDTVRSIRFGQSIELCGGTHVENTGDIWHFKITSESAVASGIRRIEAITYDAVKDYYFENNATYQEIRGLLNNAKEPVKVIQALQEDNQKLRKQIEQFQKEKAQQAKGNLKDELKSHNGIQFLFKKVELDAASIKDICFELGSQFDDLFLVFAAELNGKAVLSCYVSKPLVESHNLDAGQIVRSLGKHIQGGGGGQPFFATAGGKNPDGIPEALKGCRSFNKLIMKLQTQVVVSKTSGKSISYHSKVLMMGSCFDDTLATS